MNVDVKVRPSTGDFSVEQTKAGEPVPNLSYDAGTLRGPKKIYWLGMDYGPGQDQSAVAVVPAPPARQHVSDAAYAKVKDIWIEATDPNVLERMHSEHGLMLLTVEEYDALAVNAMNADFARDNFSAQKQWYEQALEAKDARIAELERLLAEAKKKQFGCWVAPCLGGMLMSAVRPAHPHADKAAALLNLPEQRPQFGRGNDEQ